MRKREFQGREGSENQGLSLTENGHPSHSSPSSVLGDTVEVSVLKTALWVLREGPGQNMGDYERLKTHICSMHWLGLNNQCLIHIHIHSSLTYWHFSNIYRYYWRLIQYTSFTDVTEIILPTLTCFVLYNHQISMCVLARKWGLKFILWKVSPNDKVWESQLEEGWVLWLSSFVLAWTPSLQRTTGSLGFPRTRQSRFSVGLERRFSESSAIVKFVRRRRVCPSTISLLHWQPLHSVHFFWRHHKQGQNPDRYQSGGLPGSLEEPYARHKGIPSERERCQVLMSSCSNNSLQSRAQAGGRGHAPQLLQTKWA